MHMYGALTQLAENQYFQSCLLTFIGDPPFIAYLCARYAISEGHQHQIRGQNIT